MSAGLLLSPWGTRRRNVWSRKEVKVATCLVLLTAGCVTGSFWGVDLWVPRRCVKMTQNA